MQLVFWHNILSPHQVPFMRALAASGHDVTIVATEAMSADRLALGWVVPDTGRARVIIAPNDGEVGRLIADGDKTAIHVIAGARWSRLGKLAAHLCVKSGRRIGMISESPDPRGILGCGRRAKYTMERFTSGSRFDFVLAMGEMGVKWFRSCWYAKERIVPFIYVTENVHVVERNELHGEHVSLFAGRFVSIKGLDILLRAFAIASQRQSTLRLLGEGPEKERLNQLVLNLGLQNRVCWLSKTVTSGVQKEMQNVDLTLLPSRKDGWGAVVNESLMVGTPVICSTGCGAAELIRQPWLGTVFSSGDVEDLSKVLKKWIDRGHQSQTERERICRWSNCINGESVAVYFAEIMEHIYGHAPRPVAPWRRQP